MRNRTIKKQFWINDTEEKLLKEKSKKANISEADFLRNCINDFQVKEKPDENFYCRFVKHMSHFIDKYSV